MEGLLSRFVTSYRGGMPVKSSPPTIASIGYERRTIDELVEMLLREGVEVVVDVRLNAISRKKGFSKTALSDALSDSGIEYRHERALGNPKDNRDPFRLGLPSARRRYSDHLSNGASGAYTAVVDLARNAPIALLCFERDHAQCHRSAILDRAQREDPELVVAEL